MAINDIDQLPKLKYAGVFLHPLRDGYSLDTPYGAKISSATGGMPFIRRDTINNAQQVTVSYELKNSTMVDWFMMFWKLSTLEGSLPFVCLLSLGDSEPLEYVAIATTAPTYTEMLGFNSLVTFNVAAQKLVADYEYWDLILEMSEEVDPNLWANRLEKLVLVDLPKSLGAI